MSDDDDPDPGEREVTAKVLGLGAPTEEIERLQRELADTNRGVLALYAELDQHARKLAAADERKDRFIALLAHELRNPLAVADLALDDLEPSPAGYVIRRQIRHLGRLVDDLLDVSRIARGKIVLRTSPIDLGLLVEETARDGATMLAATGHTLVFTPPAGRVVVEGDAVRLTQVLHNLLHNAGKYSPEGSTVRLSVDAVDGEARVTVADEGRGLTEEERRQIFGLFVQTSAFPDDGAGGLGIGLTLVRQLVQMQGGRVEVDSAGRGRGSVFSVWLPRSGDEPLAPVSTRPPPSSHGIEVLLVEDDDDLRELLAVRLGRRGLQVRTAASGPEALAAIAEQRPHVVVTDLGLPGMDGYALAREARELAPGLPLVALSGFGAPRDRERTAAAGFAKHFVKPVSVGALLTALAELAS